MFHFCFEVKDMGYTCKEPRLLEEVTYTSNNKDIVERGKGQLTGYILIYMQRLKVLITKRICIGATIFAPRPKQMAYCLKVL